MNNTIRFDRHGFIFSGKRRYILAGTINYFRIHPEEWESRLQAFKASGFNTVDTYVAWNYHESTEGQFDFSTFNRELGRFLSLCGKLGLWVYLRPGPYICNEWDGGGLPTWLHAKKGVEIRQNQRLYLEYVERYLHQVNLIAREHLYTKSGPIILYALENEMDFWPCRDPHGYIAALKEQALRDGIDVPLTACVGMRTRLEPAMGLVDGVIPSPNVYVGGAIERKASSAYLRVLAGQYASGRHMDNIPVIVTEMNREEEVLRRIFAGGFKGLSPFNFSGGTHFGAWNGTTNWGGQSLISTSVDFASPIAFDGRLNETYFGARRLAGLINAFEEQILACDPTTSDDGGPWCHNANLGWKDSADEHGIVYSIARGRSALVFLYNGSDQPQELKLGYKGVDFPRFGTTTVPAKYPQIVPVGMSLNHHGILATIRYATAEVGGVWPTADGAEMVLYGPAEQQGEICFDAEAAISLRDGNAEQHSEGWRSLTLVVKFGPEHRVRLAIGEKVLTLVVMDREAAGRYRLEAPQLRRAEGSDLLGQAAGMVLLEHGGHEHRWTGEAKPLEALGIVQGAAWYELGFSADAELSGDVVIEHGAEFVSAYLDGQYIGTALGNGGEVKLPLTSPLAAGTHTLRLRAEIWGHSNFDEKGWPSGRLGSLRGVWGKVKIGERELSGQWRCGREQLQPAGQAASPQGAPGQAIGCDLPLPAMPQGGTLVLQGENCTGDLLLGEVLIGRFAFGPALAVRLTGGPGNEFYLPAAMAREPGALRMIVRSVAEGGGIRSATLRPMVGQ